jgi:hypothetical protein
MPDYAVGSPKAFNGAQSMILAGILAVIFLPPLLMEIYVLWAFAFDVVRGK